METIPKDLTKTKHTHYKFCINVPQYTYVEEIFLPCTHLLPSPSDVCLMHVIFSVTQESFHFHVNHSLLLSLLFGIRISLKNII